MGEVYARFRRLLPRSRDPLLVVLKAHLLAEERLDWILRELARSPSALRDAQLSFHQKLKLCNALLGEVGAREWRFLAALNKLRNALAHNVELSDVEPRIDAAIQTLDPKEQVRFKGRAQRLTALKNAVMISCALMEGVATQAARQACAAQPSSMKPGRSSGVSRTSHDEC